MKSDSMDKLIKALIGISSLMVLAGALMKIMHYPISNSVILWGLLLICVLSIIDNSRLKKIIKGYEVEKVKNE